MVIFSSPLFKELVQISFNLQREDQNSILWKRNRFFASREVCNFCRNSLPSQCLIFSKNAGVITQTPKIPTHSQRKSFNLCHIVKCDEHLSMQNDSFTVSACRILWKRIVASRTFYVCRNWVFRRRGDYKSVLKEFVSLLTWSYFLNLFLNFSLSTK